MWVCIGLYLRRDKTGAILLTLLRRAFLNILTGRFQIPEATWLVIELRHRLCCRRVLGKEQLWSSNLCQTFEATRLFLPSGSPPDGVC